jgi:hypothetical protein
MYLTRYAPIDEIPTAQKLLLFECTLQGMYLYIPVHFRLIIFEEDKKIFSANESQTVDVAKIDVCPKFPNRCYKYE